MWEKSENYSRTLDRLGVKAVRRAALDVVLIYVARFTYYTQKSRIEKILRNFSAFPRLSNALTLEFSKALR